MFFLEVGMGQFVSEGGITVWTKFAPAFKGSHLHCHYPVTDLIQTHIVKQFLDAKLSWLCV